MYSLDLANRGLVVGVNSEKVGEGSKRDESWESFFRGIFLSIYGELKSGEERRRAFLLRFCV